MGDCMGIVIDLIILAIVALCVIISVKRGFIRTAIELAGFILAIVLAFSFSAPLADFTYNSFVKEPVETMISDSITDTVGDIAISVDAAVFDKVWDDLPAFITKNHENFGLSKENLMDNFVGSNTAQIEEFSANVADSVAYPVITMILKSVFSVLIFFLVSLLTKILAKPINKLFSFSFVGTINKTLGAILGIAQGAIWVSAFCAVVTLLVSLFPNGFLIFNNDTIKSATLFNFFSNLIPFI